MFHLLKFTYTDEESNDIIIFVVLNESQYNTFVEYGGQERAFTKHYHICGGSDRADDDDNCTFVESKILNDNNEDLHRFLTDKELYETILEWMSRRAYYRLTFTKKRLCVCGKNCCLKEKDDNYSDSLHIILDRNTYRKFKTKKGDKYSFTLPNNCLTCTRGGSSFIVWNFDEVTELDRPEGIDFPIEDEGHPQLTEVVELWCETAN